VTVPSEKAGADELMACSSKKSGHVDDVRLRAKLSAAVLAHEALGSVCLRVKNA